MKHTIGILTTVAWLVGCASQPDSVETTPAESNEIGVTQVEISHVFKGDETLVIRGLDGTGAEIAVARLRTGFVSYTPEPDSIPAERSFGRELVLSTGSFVHPSIVNPSLAQMTLPEVVEHPLLRSFLRLHAVANALDEGGIRFTSTAETPYLLGGGGTTCSGNKFPVYKPDGSPFPSPTQCCQETGGQTTHINGSNGSLARRIYYANACRNADQTTGCTSNCAIGPCKAYTPWTYAQGKVWHPFSGDGYYSNTCAWDDLNGHHWPYSWTSEPVWAGVTSSCTCYGCNSNGTPFPAGCVN